LGWVFDGACRCIELPEAKVTTLIDEIHHITRKNNIPWKQLEKLWGCLWHACIGLLAGKGLMGPIYSALCGDHQSIRIKKGGPLRETLQDFGALIKILSRQLTYCCELIADTPGFIRFCDASKLGVGGVRLLGKFHLAHHSMAAPAAARFHLITPQAPLPTLIWKWPAWSSTSWCLIILST
jgi:hypothetical protein